MILDIAVSLLLGVTILYCWKLSRRITSLHTSRRELEQFIQEFNEAIVKADHSIQVLKDLTLQTDKALRGHIETARFLSNDLSFLAHKGTALADRLEDHIASSRAVDPNPMNLRGSQSAPMIEGRLGGAAFTTSAPPRPFVPNKVLTRKEADARKPQGDISLSKKQAMEMVLEQISANKAKFEAPDAEAPLGNISAIKNSVEKLRELQKTGS